KIGTNEEIFTVDLKKGEVAQGPFEGKPDVTFSLKDEDFVKVVTGKMNPNSFSILWFDEGFVYGFYGYRGAMKIKGSLSVAQKFTPDIFPKPSKM
ncbi:hypothetical protein IFM89_021145, partial [Coptis chinensis]